MSTTSRFEFTDAEREIKRLHRPVDRCVTAEHGPSCVGTRSCRNCRERWPCRFIQAISEEGAA